MRFRSPLPLLYICSWTDFVALFLTSSGTWGLYVGYLPQRRAFRIPISDFLKTVPYMDLVLSIGQRRHFAGVCFPAVNPFVGNKER